MELLTGQVEPATGSTGCTDCVAGRFTPAAGLSVCTHCSTGRIQSTAGTTTCVDCAIGKIQSSAGTLQCPDCPAGKFTPTEGTTICTECAVGKYTATDGLGSCTECAAGYDNGELGATTCLECRVGKYMPDVASSACLSCTPGTTVHTTAATVCADCPIGRIASFEGESYETCRACPEGGCIPIDTSLYRIISRSADALNFTWYFTSWFLSVFSPSTTCFSVPSFPCSGALLPWVILGLVIRKIQQRDQTDNLQDVWCRALLRSQLCAMHHLQPRQVFSEGSSQLHGLSSWQASATPSEHNMQKLRSWTCD